MHPTSGLSEASEWTPFMEPSTALLSKCPDNPKVDYEAPGGADVDK